MRRTAHYAVTHGLPIYRTLFAVALFEALRIAATAALVFGIVALLDGK